MQFKGYSYFINDEKCNHFLSYIPIELDARCKGFQHMALLSNEIILFKELNLVRPNSKNKLIDDIPPSDFYSFLLHRLVNVFKKKLDENEVEYS